VRFDISPDANRKEGVVHAHGVIRLIDSLQRSSTSLMKDAVAQDTQRCRNRNVIHLVHSLRQGSEVKVSVINWPPDYKAIVRGEKYPCMPRYHALVILFAGSAPETIFGFSFFHLKIMLLDCLAM
jgi:hypothetical protein